MPEHFSPRALRRRGLQVTAVVALLLGLVLPAASASAASPRPTRPCGRTASAPAYWHVIWIWMENESYRSIIGSAAAPYINRLAGACGLATNYHAVDHPSLPNYEAATSGRVSATDDCLPTDCPDPNPSLFGQVRSWKGYAEDMPANCYRDNSGKYAARHNPAVYYTPIRRQCMTHDVPLGTPKWGNLARDLSTGRLPAFSFVTPDVCHDMHSCPVAIGDRYLSQLLPAIIASRSYAAGHTVIFLTWDEAEGSPTNQVPMVVIAPSVRPGSRSAALYDHYSLLRTTEQLLHAPALGAAARARSMAGSFRL